MTTRGTRRPTTASLALKPTHTPSWESPFISAHHDPRMSICNNGPNAACTSHPAMTTEVFDGVRTLRRPRKADANGCPTSRALYWTTIATAQSTVPKIWGCSYEIHRPWRTLHSRPGLGLAAVSITPDEGVAGTTILTRSAWLAPERQLSQHWLVTDQR